MRTLCLLVVLALASQAFGGDGEYSIIISPTASPAEKRGADEIQKYVKQLIGVNMPIVSRADHGITIGVDPHLGAEEFSIVTSDGDVTINGGSPRGAMYGCDEYLERAGVRFLTPKVTVVPHLQSISLKNVTTRQSPAFEYRETDILEATDKDFSAHLRFNGASHHLDESTGGKIDYHHFVHTLDDLVPQDLFATHPEYFPLIEGQRKSGYVQRCLSNPDVLKLAIERVQQWIKERPDAQIYSVSQNDTGNSCQCDNCKAIAAKYGGVQSGIYLWFVNQVAEAIEKDHPDKLIDTLAYQFTEAPPANITPRKNVRVRLCPIDCCEAHPYESCSLPANRKFIEHLQGWSKLTDSLYIWHYNTDFANYLMPFPDFDQFPDSVRLYRKTGVKGIFFEGDYAPGGASSDAELRAYVIGKLLWNPDLDVNALVDDWMNGVYGPAAKPMRQWFDLLHAKVRDPNTHLRIYDPPTSAFLSAEVIARGDQFFDEAERLAAHEDVAREYIAKARLGLRYVKLMQHPHAGADLDSFLADVRKVGITQLREGQSVDDWEKKFREQLKK